mmetsp:Transcript_13593/g.27848  ORF Transcript_13593/g.27848 Transcript_13593/m.27848 type:complete len:540 (-) Transcript_13593:472-2091(-)
MRRLETEELEEGEVEEDESFNGEVTEHVSSPKVKRSRHLDVSKPEAFVEPMRSVQGGELSRVRKLRKPSQEPCQILLPVVETLGKQTVELAVMRYLKEKGILKGLRYIRAARNGPRFSCWLVYSDPETCLAVLHELRKPGSPLIVALPLLRTDGCPFDDNGEKKSWKKDILDLPPDLEADVLFLSQVSSCFSDEEIRSQLVATRIQNIQDINIMRRDLDCLVWITFFDTASCKSAAENVEQKRCQENVFFFRPPRLTSSSLRTNRTEASPLSRKNSRELQAIREQGQQAEVLYFKELPSNTTEWELSAALELRGIEGVQKAVVVKSDSTYRGWVYFDSEPSCLNALPSIASLRRKHRLFAAAPILRSRARNIQSAGDNVIRAYEAKRSRILKAGGRAHTLLVRKIPLDVTEGEVETFVKNKCPEVQSFRHATSKVDALECGASDYRLCWLTFVDDEVCKAAFSVLHQAKLETFTGESVEFLPTLHDDTTDACGKQPQMPKDTTLTHMSRCAFFEKGTCLKGSACQFLHSRTETESASES